MKNLQDIWAAFSDHSGCPEQTAFETLMRDLRDGAAPDMLGDTETVLEELAGERGFSVMRSPSGDGAVPAEVMDPAYFAALRESADLLGKAATEEEQRSALDLLMRHIFDAYDLGRGRALAGGERALQPLPSSQRH